jgi:predicted NUDIX family NTP pyrophosphohydrolase
MRRSAGLMLYRRSSGLEVLLVRPGGPWFAHLDEWGIPKGEYGADELPYDAAHREFAEETGFPPPTGPALALGEVTQRSGKRVLAWAMEGELDVTRLVSNTVRIPYRGRMREFPEIEEGRWFDLAGARGSITPAQSPFLDRLEALLPF